ncbi:MAG: hypothetical protein U0350_19720 [Caldilineaceae bacterium]
MQPRRRSASGQAGHGLQGMHERLALLGGQLNVESTPGAGTHLAATAPTQRFMPMSMGCYTSS